MAKRSARSQSGADAFRKRQKITQDAPTGEEVTSATQLRQLLAFDQDLQKARHGLVSFKKLLDTISPPHDPRNQSFLLLKDYLQAVKPRNADRQDATADEDDERDDVVYLNDIMEMWSFASQTNNDNVMSSVAVVLALLLSIISHDLDLVPYGLGICATLLQERQLKSLSKNLSVDRSKGFILSPTLRLLREVVCFDGGACAKRLFRARHATLHSLARNLEVGQSVEAADDPRKTSVRTNAVLFFLSCLKYMPSEGRRELLTQKDLFSHLTYMMQGDPPHLVIELLAILKQYVLLDDKITRDVKFRSFNTKTLLRITALYNYASPLADDSTQVDEAAHQFLIYVCTNSAAGVLYPSTGLYPKPGDGDAMGRLESHQKRTDHDREPLLVYNFVLSEFARKLRPWSSLKHNELLVAIFKAAPELIADYFVNNRSFSFDPKLSMTWIGYAAFLFNTMMIPIPAFFGDRALFGKAPPSPLLILDNVLPLPLNQKVLVRCLSSKSELAAFFATRIMVQAFDKLAEALRILATTDSEEFVTTGRQITDGFCQRVPDMKEVVRLYKSIPADHVLHRTTTSRLLRLYYEVTPKVALAANFDVTPFFVNILQTLNTVHDQDEKRGFLSLQLENLVSIASYSPGMKWFTPSKNLSEGMTCSPFTALLRLLCDRPSPVSPTQLRRVLTDVAVEAQVVSAEVGLSPFLRSWRCVADELDDAQKGTLWTYLDSAINRCASSPLKYLEMLAEKLSSREPHSTDTSYTILNAALVEQLPFAKKDADEIGDRGLQSFLSLYMNALSLCNEDPSSLKLMHDQVTQQFGKANKISKIGSKSELRRLRDSNLQSGDADDRPQDSDYSSSQSSKVTDDDELASMLHVPTAQKKEDPTALTKWSTKTVHDLIDDDWIPRLVRLLASPHPHIRKEALTALLHVTAKFKGSSHEEAEQIWLLLSELTESARPLIDHSSSSSSSPVPSSFIAFTIHALPILLSPLHPLYPKLNTFLTSSPYWEPTKLPLAHSILHSAPSPDDKYYTELSFLLSYLLDALVHPGDVDTFHKKRWFEKIFALLNNPFLRTNLKTKLWKILYRVTEIEGGCEMLFTRFGVLSWLDAHCNAASGSGGATSTGRSRKNVVADEGDAAVLRALMKKVYAGCDQTRVDSWSQGGIQGLMQRVGR